GQPKPRFRHRHPIARSIMTPGAQREVALEDETALRSMIVDRTSQTGSSEVRHRASVCQFSTDAARVGDREPECDLHPPAIDLDTLRSRLSEVSRDFELELKVQTGRRRYRDS